LIQNAKLFIEFTPESAVFVYEVENQIYFEAFVDENQSEHADFSDASLIEVSEGKDRIL